MSSPVSAIPVLGTMHALPPAPAHLGAAVVLGLALAVLLLLLPFALHRTILLLASRRKVEHGEGEWRGPLPTVTVQLPVFNEVDVVERLLDAVAALRYPVEKLEVQVLDDSTDETSAKAARMVEDLHRQGRDVQHIRRETRDGFKAGALAHGHARSKGEFILILDADFVPDDDLIHRLLPSFQDRKVGMVQARWDHLNEERGWLTRAEALLLDGHFFFEHGGRAAAGCFFNFNGTAGMWRRRCLDDAGGWSSDTLTEDLDLSYRAQMKGWRFVFREDVGVPAELPEDVSALEVQQQRWAQGGIQTARKILPSLLRGPWPLRVKAEAGLHLLGHLAHPLTLLLALLLFPSAVARRTLGLDGLPWLDVAVFGAATLPFLLYYGAAARRRGRSWKGLLPRVLTTLVVGVGLSASLTRAVIRGGIGMRDPFRRTPKVGGRARSSYGSPGALADRLAKFALMGTLLTYAWLAVEGGYFGSLPFILLFAMGYLWLGAGELLQGTRHFSRFSRTPATTGGSQMTTRRRGGLGQVPVAR